MNLLGTRGKNSAFIAVLASVAAIALAAAAASPSSTPTSKKTYRLGLVLPQLTNQAIKDIQIGAERRAKQLGNVRILTVGQESAEVQAKAFDDYIAARVDAIAVNPIDATGICAKVRQAKRAGIPTIAIIVKPQCPVAAFISADFKGNGRKIGVYLAKAMGRKGNAALLEGDPADLAAQQLEAGFRAGLKAAGPQVKLVADQATYWDREKAFTVAQNVLTANPDLQGIYGMNDDMAMSALRAIKAANRKIILVGHNGTCEALSSIVSGGGLRYTVMLFTQAIGALYVDTALKVLKRQKVRSFVPTPSYGVATPGAKAILAGKLKPPANIRQDVIKRLKLAKAGC